MKKRLLSLALAICMVAAMLPTFAVSASALEVGQTRSYYFGTHDTTTGIDNLSQATAYDENLGRYWRYKTIRGGTAKGSQLKPNRLNGYINGVADSGRYYIALEILVPEDGIYKAEYFYCKLADSNGTPTGGKGKVYILPEGTALGNIPNAIKKGKEIAAVDYSPAADEKNKVMGPVVAEGIGLKKGNNILLFLAEGKGENAIYNISYDHYQTPSSLTLTLTKKDEDEELTSAFNPTPVDVPTQYAPAVSALKYVDGEESNVDAIAVSAKDEDGDGTYNVSTSTTDNSYKFLYWVKGKSTSKIIVSRTESFTYTPGNGDVNYLIAVYEKDGETKDKAEFYNANGQLIAAVEGTTVETPDLPSMAGYGEASKWVNANGEKFGGKVNVNISGTVMFIAEYAEPTTTFTIDTTKCETDKTLYKYGDLVKCTATGTTEDGTFKCWKRDGVVVSTKPEYTFSAWKNHAVEAVYIKDEFTFNGVAQQIILEIFGDNVMAEFIGFTNVVEKGIILDTQEIAMTTDKTQFTVENNVGATTAKGYVIVKDGTGFKKYTDGDITLTPDAE